MRKKIFKIILPFLALSWLFGFSLPALAIPPEGLWGQGVRNYIKSNSSLPSEVADPRILIINIINIVLGFLGIIAVILILYAGFRWMTAGGNEENIAAAKKILIAGIIGLVIILAAFALANFVINQLIGATTGVTPI